MTVIKIFNTIKAPTESVNTFLNPFCLFHEDFCEINYMDDNLI
jgi:hypothetical protein